MKNIQNELGTLVNIILQNVYTNQIEVGAADRLIKEIMDIREDITKGNTIVNRDSSDIKCIDEHLSKMESNKFGKSTVQYNHG